MPTYSYRCTACGNAFDIQQAFTDDSLTECPACAGALRKIFNVVGVTFNGSGFYRTDSAKPAGKSGEASAKSDSSTSAGSPTKSGSSSGGGSGSPSGGTSSPTKAPAV